MSTLKKYWPLILGILAAFLIVKACEQEPQTIVKTKVVYKDRIDTIIETKIKEVKKPVYVERIKTIKGKDSIIYRDKPSDNTLEAKQYDTELIANDAKAKLNIIALGEVIDVKGTIQWKEKETTHQETVIKPNSGLFLYGGTSFAPAFTRFDLGLDYQIRNTLIIGVSASYDNTHKVVAGCAKLGFRIF